MPPTVLQTESLSINFFGIGTTASIPFSSPNTLGSAIVAIVAPYQYNSQAASLLISDDAGNSYALAGVSPNDTVNWAPYFSPQVFVYVASNVAAGANALKIKNIDNQDMDLDVTVHEIGGASTTPLGNIAMSVDPDRLNNGDTITTPAITTAYDDELLLSFVYDSGNRATTFTADSGWTSLAQTDNTDRENLLTVSNIGSTAGTFDSTFTFTGTRLYDAVVGIISILKTGDVAPALVSTNPTALGFSYVFGETAPASQSVVLNSDPTTYSIVSSQPWLTATPDSGSSPATFTVSVDPTGLVADYYNGTLTVTVDGAPNSPIVINVSFNIASSRLSVTPLTLNFSGQRFSAIPTQTITATANGADVSSYTNDSWYTINSTNYVVASSPSVLIVGVDSTRAAGTYTDVIHISARNNTDHTDALDSPIEVTITLVITEGISTTLPPNAHWKQSRFPAMTRVLYPLVPPPPPSYTVKGNDYTFALPPDNRDVFGILIQTRRSDVQTAGGIRLSSDIPDHRQFKIVGQDIKGNYLEEIVKMDAFTGFTEVVSTKPFAWILWVDVYYGTMLNEVPTPFPDGATTTFTVAHKIVPDSETIYVDGQPLVPPTPTVPGDYTILDNTFTLTGAVPLETGFGILVNYAYELTTNSTVRISWYSTITGSHTGVLKPDALQWLSNKIVYRYEDVTLSMLPPMPGTALSLGSPIVGPVVNDPGLTFTMVGLCEPAVGAYVGRDNPPEALPGAGPQYVNAPPTTFYNIPPGIEMHGYICPDKLYVYYYNLLDEMSLPFIVQIQSPLSDVLNVKTDYGAVGDGVSDDTAAVQCALDQAHKNWLKSQEPIVGSPPAGGTGPTIVLIPSGCNCLVGHKPIILEQPTQTPLYEPLPYSYTMQNAPLFGSSSYFGALGRPPNPSNIGAFALRIQSGVTLQVEGQLTMARPAQNIPAWRTVLKWSRRMLVGLNVHDVIIKGNGIIDMNGVPYFDNNSGGGLGAISLYGYDLRIEDVRIQNTGWETNLAKNGIPYEYVDNSTGLPITVDLYEPLYDATNAIGIEVFSENKATVVKNVTVDGSGVGPTRYQAWGSATIFYQGSGFLGISGTGVGEIQNWGFAAAIMLVSDALATIPNPAKPSRLDPGPPPINYYEFWTSEDVSMATGVLIEKNKIIRCLGGILGAADNYTVQNNDLTACWIGIAVHGGKKVTVKGNMIGWDDTPIIEPDAVDPYTPNLPIVGFTHNPISFLGNPIFPATNGFGNGYSNPNANGTRPIGIAITVEPCDITLTDYVYPGQVNGIGYRSGRLMGCRVYDNNVSHLAIGTGIDSYFVAGNPDVSGVMQSPDYPYNTRQYMADIEIFGNSCNNNWKGFALTPGGVLPYQRINLHDNQARKNNAYRGVLFQGPIGVGVPVAVPPTWGVSVFAGSEQHITGWALRGADFPAWEEVQFGWSLHYQKGNFEVPDSSRPRGLSWNNPAIRNEIVIDGWVFRHWYYQDNYFPIGQIDGFNREFDLPVAPEINFPYAKVVQQFSFTQQRAGDMTFDYIVPAVQDAPPGGEFNSYAAFPQPRKFRSSMYRSEDEDSRNGGSHAFFWGNIGKRIYFFNTPPNSPGAPETLLPPDTVPHMNQALLFGTDGLNKLAMRMSYKYIADQSQGYVTGNWSEFAGFQTGWTPNVNPPPPAPDEDPDE